jgi:hypothetical protein
MTTIAEAPPKVQTQPQADALVGVMRAVVELASARGSELVAGTSAQAEYEVVLKQHWTFAVRECAGQLRMGYAHIDGAHWGTNQHGFEHERQSRHAGAPAAVHSISQVLREHVNRGVEGLGKSELLVHDFGRMSVSCTCNACAGDGEVNCHSCWGTALVSCGFCAGSGREPENYTAPNGVQTRYVTCRHCSGSARRSCPLCIRGQLRCRECSGHGGFTRISHLQLVATTRSRSVSGKDLGASTARDLECYAQRYNASSLKRVFEFDEAHVQAFADASGFSAHYPGKVMVTSVAVSFRGRSHRAEGIGRTCVDFIRRPALLDGLLVNQARLDGGSRMTRREARRCMERLRENKVTEDALRRRAQGAASLDAVTSSSQGFISTEVASRLATQLESAQNVASPSYSLAAWWVWSLPGVVTGFCGGMLALRSGPLGESALHLVYAAIAAGVVQLAGSVVAAATSVGVVAWLRRGVPREVRPKAAHFSPFRMAMSCLVLAGYAGMATGVADRNGLLPAGMVEPVAAQASKVLHSAHAFFRSQTLRPPSRQSEQDRLLTVQAALKAKGYKVAVDGRNGPQTRAALARFAAEQHLTAADLDTVYAVIAPGTH